MVTPTELAHWPDLTHRPLELVEFEGGHRYFLARLPAPFDLSRRIAETRGA